MSTNLSDYYQNLRTALADPGTAGVYAWQDESLAGAIITVVETGIGPAGVSVNSTRTALNPAPASPDARGYLVFQAALLLIGGQIPASFRTRAMSVSYNPAERELTMAHIRGMVRKIEREGDPHGTGQAACFGIWQDMENALTRATLPYHIVRNTPYTQIDGV